MNCTHTKVVFTTQEMRKFALGELQDPFFKDHTLLGTSGALISFQSIERRDEFLRKHNELITEFKTANNNDIRKALIATGF